MKLVKWKVSDGARLLDCGSKVAESEREVLDDLLARKLGKFDAKAERSYRLEAGSLVASSYGDEFETTLGASNLDDTAVTSGGHLFSPPKVAGLPCPHRLMNRDVWIDGERYAGCDDCDFVSPFPVASRLCWPRYGQPDPYGYARQMTEEELQSQADASVDPYSRMFPIDADRARDERALKELGTRIRNTIVRPFVQKLVEGVVDEFGRQRSCHPEDHAIEREYRPEYAWTKYSCASCGSSFFLTDAERFGLREPLESVVRDRLTEKP